MRKTSYAAAMVEALRASLANDPHVTLVGSYVLGLGPKRVLMDPIRAEFPDRLYDPPISEAALVSLGAGAAMAGARPFVDLGTGSFSYVGWSPLVNEAAVARYMSGGRLRVPVVYHCCMVCAAAAPRSTATVRRRCCGTRPAWRSCCHRARAT